MLKHLMLKHGHNPSGVEVAKCREVLSGLAVILKALDLYPRRNRATDDLVLKFYEEITSFLEEYGEMRLETEGPELFYKRQKVFASRDRVNMASLLSTAGIREFVFRKGFEKKELDIILDALKTYCHLENRRDLIMLLWRDDLKNISYSIPKEFFEKGVLELRKPEGPETAREKEASFAVRGGRGIFDIVFEAFKSGFEKTLHLTPEALSPEELEILKHGFDTMNADVLPGFVQDILLKLIKNPADEKKSKDPLAVYSKIVMMLAKSMMEKGDTGGLLDLLKKLCAAYGQDNQKNQKNQKSEAPDQDQAPDQNCNAAIENIIRELASLKAANWFLSTSGSRIEIEKFLFLIGPYKVETLLDVLSECQDRRTRKVICNILAFMAPQKMEEIGSRLADDRWYVVRNIVYVLGMSGSRVATGLVKRVLDHGSTKVRRECVKAFEALPAAGTYAPLAKLLSDTDTTVRISALKALSRKFSGAAELFGAVQKIVSEVDFPGRPFDEKAEFLGAYGLLGGERSFILLRDYFTRRGLLTWYDQDELRAASASGLAHVPLAEAALLLEKGARSRSALLRNCCCSAFETRQKKFIYSPKMDEMLGTAVIAAHPSSAKIS
ncbi:MAG: HEAT repeat domain-containing protein [Nitrospiraceae bacterium]|nr:HEAT repeat domain-containing protein [Nitrospiraceae bacterium]